MDDLVLMSDDRRALERTYAAIAGWLARERRLTLKDPAAPVRATDGEVLYLGHRLTRAGARPLAGRWNASSSVSARWCSTETS